MIATGTIEVEVDNGDYFLVSLQGTVQRIPSLYETVQTLLEEREDGRDHGGR